MTRFTANPVSVPVTVEGVSDSQIPELYYEITNVTTGQTVVEKTNKAQKTGTFDAVFNNVFLTEGLNKIVVKLGETSVIASAPAWAYFTPTTNLESLYIDGKPFEDGKIYPENPAQSTVVNISGRAPNATEVRVYVEGDPTPKNAYFNNGDFFFVADDINKPTSTANFRLRPGDNPMTIMAVSNTKSYQISKNLIYDNGKPFAFNAKIKEQGQPDSAKKNLISTPTVTSNQVNISAYLKDDLTALGDLQYRYVEVSVGGQTFGPYNLTGADPAPKAMSVSPATVYEGHSDMYLFVTGEALANARLNIANVGGANVVTDQAPVFVDPSQRTAVYAIPQGTFTKASGPYKVTIRNGTGATAPALHAEPFTIAVNTPPTTPPKVQATSIPSPFPPTPGILAKAGSTIPSQTVTFDVAVNPTDVIVSVTDLNGNPVGTALGSSGTTTVSFTLPTIQVEGLYKYKISHQGIPLTERMFEIGKKDPPDPTVSIAGTITVTANGTPGTPTTLYFPGTNLGTNPADFMNVQLVDINGMAPTVTGLTVFDARNDHILVTIPDQSQLVAGTKYQLQFDKRLRYPDGTDSGLVKSVTAGTVTDHVYAQAQTGTAAVTNVTIPQMLPSEVGTTTVQIQGSGLASVNNLSVVVTNEDGANPRSARAVSANGTSATADFTTVTGLTPGNYMLRISYNNELLGQFPFVVVDPTPTGFSEVGNQFVVTGSNFGRNATSFKLRFIPDANPQQYIEALNPTLEAGSKLTFNKPAGLANGSYTVRLMYNGTDVGNPFIYNVSAAAASLKEVASWSKPGRYKVFEFSADLDIPPDRVQLVSFRFFNSPTDSVTSNTFTFYYVDPNLPYVELVKRGDGFQLSEGGLNQISELPMELKVYADEKTEKVNVYLGNYDGNSAITQTLTAHTPDTIAGKTYRVFSYPLPATITNGSTKITFVPSSDPALGNDKVGENVSGKKQYDLLISNVPYVIVHNIYNGLVVKTPNLEITCIRNDGDTVATGSCVSGRLVNMPTIDSANYVEILVNDRPNNTFLLKSDGKSFSFIVNDLAEGKNTIKLNIYVNSTLVTSSQYEVFVFSTNAPEFLYIKPIEPTSTGKKFVEGQKPDTYATSETAVAFSGQFANATEIKLTVRMKDENGVPIVKYDRRYNNFSYIDPQNNNPNYFRSIAISTGQFETNPITLASTGETVFEFTITNASGITVTRTITIAREPLPYVVIYPVLTKNSKGQDQANINSNFIEIELEAEGADTVLFGKEEAIQREVTDQYGVKKKHFFYEATGLKAGANTIKFTVVRGTSKTNGSFILFNVNTPVEGAQYKTTLQPTMKVFNGELELKFPRGTNLMRNDPSAVNQYLTADRKILFGIANSEDGRVDKYKHPSASDGQIGNPNPIIGNEGKLILTEPTGRFRPASKLYWIDAGTIGKNETDLVKALTGSGRLPYDRDEFYLRNQEDLVVPTQRGTLTLKFDANIRDDAWRYLTVYHFDIYEDYTGTVQWRWRNLGGVVNMRNNTITVPFDTFGYYQVMYMDKSFDDVTAHPWARNDLDTLYAKGIMLNKNDSTFVPNDPISRGEFATLLVKIFDLPLQYSEVPTFSDVPRVNLLTRLYDYKYIETAARAGIVRGAAQGRFLPDNAITRQDAALMIARAANLKMTPDYDIDKVRSNLQKQFTDANLIDIYAMPAVEAVVKAGLIEGKENLLQPGQKKPTLRFDPLESFTRAEAATVAMRVLRQQKKVP